MKLLGAHDHRRMAWRNGGGETLEVAIFPADAGIDAFGWRVSMAIVAQDGAFSIFAGADRTLVLLVGDGITLEVAGRDAVTLSVDSPPFAFPADVATIARLRGGTITDRNVMTARGRYVHVVERCVGPRMLVAGPSETLLLLGVGATVEASGERAALGAGDLVRLAPDERAHVSPAAGATWLLIAIRPAG